MSILSYRPIIVGNIQPTLQQVIIVPNGNTQPPVPPDPPIPPTPGIGGGSGCCNQVVYECINGKLLDSPKLLNGTYVSKNNNGIPDVLTSQNILNLERYASGTQKGLAITDSKLSILDNQYFFFWIYPLYSSSFLKPITICTKGNQISSGEYTIQITTDRRLTYSYTLSSGATTILKSVNQVPEKQLTFVSVIKTSTIIYIYFNGKLDSQQSIFFGPAATGNPILIGTGYNSASLEGYLDNFVIANTAANNWPNLISSYYSYVPDSYLYQFLNGKITFNGYNYSKGSTTIQPGSIENAKAICTLLENYTNGFTINSLTNEYIYFASYNGLTDTNLMAPTIYNKIGVLTINNNIFTRLRITSQTDNNVDVVDPILINGYIKAFTGETFYFINGEAYEYDTVSKIYTLVPMSIDKANYILFAINQNIAYKISMNRYLFYGYASNYISNGGKVPNIVIKKFLKYTIGGINTLVDYSGVSEAGTWTYYSDVKYLNICSDPLMKMIDQGEMRKDESVINPIVINPERQFDEQSKISPIVIKGDILEYTQNAILTTLYIYETNGMNLMAVLNRNSDFYLSALPKLFGRYDLEFTVDYEVDIIDFLLRKEVPYNKFIIIDLEKQLAPGIYNLSVVCNTLMKITIGEREYIINTNNPQHIVFHQGRKPLEIQISLDWQRINQIAKFVLIEA